MEGKDNSLKSSSDAEKKTKIELHLFINKIMQELKIELEFSKNQKVKMFNVIKENQKQFSKYNLQSFIIYSDNKMKIENFDKKHFLKMMILSVFYYYSCLKKKVDIKDKNKLFQANYTAINMLTLTLIKLYQSQFLDINDLMFFSKLFILLSISNIKTNDISNSTIKLFLFLKCSVIIIQNIAFNSDKIIHNFMFDETIANAFKAYLTFFTKTLLINNEHNIFLLQRYEKDYLQLFSFINILRYINDDTERKKLQNCIIDFLSKIYQFNFSYSNVMLPFVEQMKEIFINNSTKTKEDLYRDTSIADYSICYINSLIEKENQIISKDENLADNAVYLSGKHSPIIISEFEFKMKSCLIFSFNLSPLYNILKDNYVLISIQENENFLLKLSIKKNKNTYSLNIETKDKLIQTSIEIFPYVTYILCISLQDSKVIIDYSFSNKIMKKEIKISKFSSKEKKIMCIGCETNGDSITTFEGYFGSLIYIEPFKYNADFIRFVFLLKGRYENIITLLKYDNTFTNNYIGVNDRNYFEVVERIKLFYLKEPKLLSDILKNIQFCFSSRRLQFKGYENEIIPFINYNKKTSQKEDVSKSFTSLSTVSSSHSLLINNENYSTKRLNIYSELNDNVKFTCNKYFNKNFHSITNKQTLFAFIDNDGLSFISLQLEYYYQILSRLNCYENNTLIVDKM